MEAVLAQAKAGSIRPAGLLVLPPSGSEASATANPLPPSGSLEMDDAGDNHTWNPSGTGSMLAAFPFPVFLLDKATGKRALEGAAANRMGGAAPGLDWSRALSAAKADARMSTLPGTNASQCLAGGTCLPLGGHTVWAERRLGSGAAVAILAAQDAPTFFHTTSAGAGGERGLSGLITVLVAAKLVGRTTVENPGSPPARPIVFAALAGERWGHLGSRRLFYEAEEVGDPGARRIASAGLVLEVGSVGQRSSPALYLHGAEEGGEVLAAVRRASPCLPLSVRNASVGSLPPFSSLRAFRRATNEALEAGALLSDYDAALPADVGAPAPPAPSLRAPSIAAAAVLVARTALEASSPGRGEALDARDAADAVEDLLACVGPRGRDCALVEALLGEPAEVFSGYVGVLYSITQDPSVQDPMAKADRARFLHAYLAYALAGKLDARQRGEQASEAGLCGPAARRPQDRCPSGLVCAGSWAGGASKGECLNVSASFVPAYPTGLACPGCDGLRDGGKGWQFSDTARAWEEKGRWPAEPFWMESNWPVGTPRLITYLRPSRGESSLAPWLGVLVAGTYLAVTACGRHVIRSRGPMRDGERVPQDSSL